MISKSQRLAKSETLAFILPSCQEDIYHDFTSVLTFIVFSQPGIQATLFTI
jgi:hypothetical protein